MVNKKNSKAEDEEFNFIVRIANTDIDGQKRAIIGLQSIKGVGARTAHTIVKRAKVDETIKLGSLEDAKVKELEELVTTFVEYAPNWAVNRQMDYETGADMHLIGMDLNMIQEEDVNRLKSIRCYRGIRHGSYKKVRGQRTRTNGRKGLTLGVSRR